MIGFATKLLPVGEVKMTIEVVERLVGEGGA